MIESQKIKGIAMQLRYLWQVSLLVCVYAFVLSGCARHSFGSWPSDGQMPTQSAGQSSSMPPYNRQYTTIDLSPLQVAVSRDSAPADGYPYSSTYDESKYIARLPQHINLGKEKVILVDPKRFAWGAYDKAGNLVKGGIASAGADYCPDDKGPCRTTIGTFRIYSLGSEDCASRVYPRPKGGSLMPYCMFFHKGESLHGSPDHMFKEANISHGCIHVRIPDAEWLRNDFAKIGTKVVILPYD